MKVIDPGHTYELDQLDSPYKVRLDFAKRIGAKYPGNANPRPGTTTQEVIRAVIDRTKHVQQQRAWHENVLVISCLRMALWLLEVRAKKARGEFFERPMIEIEKLPTCPQCLHIDCTKHASAD